MALPGKNGDTRQLPLPLFREAEFLRCYFGKATGKNISLSITENSTSMLSIRHGDKFSSVRLHKMFLNAGEDILEEISEFIKTGKGRMPLVRGFIRINGPFLKKPGPRQLRLKTCGSCHDLLDIYNFVNAGYFEGRISAAVTWGARTSRRWARKRTLGSYSSRTGTIRINPLLDKKTVPRFFVEFVMYHEMLHADIGIRDINGRRSVHSREFRKREKIFKDYEKAMAWERRWL